MYKYKYKCLRINYDNNIINININSMDKLLICKKYPKHISKIKKIHHENEIYYELLIDRNYTANDTLLFETNPYKCNKCGILLSKYEKMFKLCKTGLFLHFNPKICEKIIKKIKKMSENNIQIESDAIGNETLWYIHLCYKCNHNKTFNI